LIHVLERRLKRRNENPLPDILLVDGGKPQLNAAIKVFVNVNFKPPIILSIVKGSNRIRATETILSEHGIIEFPTKNTGFLLLQQIRDESHRFAITSNRKKKNKAIRYSALDNVSGLGVVKKKSLLNHFKSLKRIKDASIHEMCMVKGISIKLAKEIQKTL